MTNKKSGVSMGGSIEYTRSKKTKQFIEKKDNQKKKRSQICIDCKDNKEGYCNKHKNWCGKVNYICLGVKDPYEKTSKQNKPINKKPNKAVSKRQVKQLKGQCNNCVNSNGSGHCNKFKSSFDKALKQCKTKHFDEKNKLGQVVKPNFDTTKLTRKKDL